MNYLMTSNSTNEWLANNMPQWLNAGLELAGYILILVGILYAINSLINSK